MPRRGNLESRQAHRTPLARAGGVLSALLAAAAMLVAAPAGASSQDVHFTLTPIFFGSVVLGTSSTQQSIVTNSSLQPIYFISASPSPTNVGAEFHASQGSCTAAVLPGTSCDLSVVFAPNAKGLRASTLFVRFGFHDLSGHVTRAATIATRIQGHGTPPTFTLSGGSAGSVKVLGYGSASATITNTSIVPLTVHGYHLSNDGDHDWVITANTCPAPVLPGGSCNLVATFHPHRLGADAATLTVSMLVAGTRASLVSRQSTLRGTGVSVSGNPPFVLSSLDFGQVTVGTSATGTVVLTNTSTRNETFSADAINDNASGAYAVTGESCPTPIAPATSCDITISYAPAAEVTHNAALVVRVSYVNSHGVLVTVGAQTSLSGRGVNPTFTLTPSTFPVTTLGSTSNGTVTVTNTSLVPLTYFLTTFQGSDPDAWAQSGSTCTAPIAPGQSCTLAIAFSPHQQGVLAITIQVTLDLTVRTHTQYVLRRAPLVGRGKLPTFTISSPSFPATPRGVAVSAQATITNTSAVSLSYDAAGISGINAAAFAVTATTCSGLIGPGASCQVTVQFKPLGAPGIKHAQLKVIMLIAGLSPHITTSDNRQLTATES